MIESEAKDEAGILALYFNKTLEIIETLIIAVKNQTEVMTSVSNKLTATGKQFASGTDQNDIVAGVVKQIYANMKAVAISMEDMSRNVSYLKSMVGKLKV